MSPDTPAPQPPQQPPTPPTPPMPPAPAPEPEPSPVPGPLITPSTGMPGPAPGPVPMPAAPPPSKKKFSLPALIIAGVLLLSGAAAAYYTVVAANKPEKKLASAFSHLVDQNQMTLDGKVDYSSGSGDDAQTITFDFNLKLDMESKQVGMDGDLGISGTSFPYDLRYVDENLYFKVGGLASAGDLSGLASGTDAEAYLALLATINDQWYVVDRSLFAQAGEENECLAKIDFTLTDEDVDKIGDAYNKHPLFTIESTSSADVDGESTTKMVLDPADDEVAEDFVDELESLSIVNEYRKCYGEDASSGNDDDNSSDTADTDEADEEDVTYVVYVDSSKQFKRWEITGKSGDVDTTIVIDFNFGDVNVEAPEDAKPLQDLLGGMLSGATMPAGADSDDLDVLFQ